ncbi:Autoinducer 2-degrading protein LsrG [Hartmannibacter diazotrophicus]|uniref:Autoinducer 2-degrading protein LsrG n=1 Tax=Hartmannibacter diazotrophicus TaxID=1482074 RepID=A0A2C9D1B1_9HYPH|nr:putative quinol monooxygenase [Hartmannibacter diazotrophicus]SON54013.1 Autoinducer 2-degrading protein LsrG [Hartmannibacter diazotrophicus]
MSTPVKVMAVLLARPGRTDDLQALLFGMVEACRSEPGNLRWDVWRDQSDPTRFVLDELYADDSAVAAHRQTPHFKHYFSKINDLAERTALVLDAARVA